MTLLKSTNLEILTQLHDLLNHLSDDMYACPLDLLHGASIGQHVRHTLEFYQCLCEQFSLGFVDYDARARQPQLELDSTFAQLTALGLMDQVQRLPEPDYIHLHTSHGADPLVIQTTVGREMHYLAEHAIHHFAMIRIALCKYFSQISVPPQFGVAYSTLIYQNNLQR